MQLFFRIIKISAAFLDEIIIKINSLKHQYLSFVKEIAVQICVINTNIFEPLGNLVTVQPFANKSCSL